MNSKLVNKILFSIFAFSFVQNVQAKEDAPYTCYSSHQYNKGLDNTSDTKPIAGATYKVDVGGTGEAYNATCIGNSDGTTKDYFYKAEYVTNYESAGDDYVKLNDNVDVKTAISIAGNGYVPVPFENVDNKTSQLFINKDTFQSGDAGEVTLRLRKTIFNGTIDIPSFSVNLYAKFGTDGDYNDKPLTVIVFKKSEIDVKALCSLSPLSLSKTGIKSIIAENKYNIGSDTLHISCDSTASDGTIYLTLKGVKFPADSRFFTSKMHEVGIGIKSDSGEYIYPNIPIELNILNGKASLPLTFESYFKKSAGAPSSSNIADLGIKGEITVK